MSEHNGQGAALVRCAECRHLRVRERGTFVEPDAAYRVSGGSVHGPVGTPECDRDAFPLDAEFEATPGPHSQRVLDVLWKQRDCMAFEVLEVNAP